MRASLNKITTDSEGASKIVFEVPSNELADVMILHQYFGQEIVLTIGLAPAVVSALPPEPHGEPEPIL